MKTGTDGSVQIEESTEGGMEFIQKKKKSRRGKRPSAVRQVLKPPAHPALPTLLKSHPFPPTPSLAARGGESTWAQHGGGDEKKTQHTRMEAELLT